MRGVSAVSSATAPGRRRAGSGPRPQADKRGLRSRVRGPAA